MSIKWQESRQNDTTDKSVHFRGDPKSGSTHLCRISHEALQDFFGAQQHGVPTHHAYMEAFQQHADDIHDLAEKRINAGELNDRGGADITNSYLLSIHFHPRTAVIP